MKQFYSTTVVSFVLLVSVVLLPGSQQSAGAQQRLPASHTPEVFREISPAQHYETLRPTVVLREPRADALVMHTYQKAGTRMQVIAESSSYVKIISRNDKPPGYVLRRDVTVAGAVQRPLSRHESAPSLKTDPHPGAADGPAQRPVPSSAASFVQQCDRLAANPHDPHRRAAGVPWDAIQSTAAIAACRKALESHPDDVVLVYQLGRALDKAGLEHEALEYFKAAAAKDYPFAFSSIVYTTLISDDDKISYWCRYGAQIGSPECMFYMGIVYYFGYGATPLQQQMTRNQKRSDYWFAQAIKHGIEESVVTNAKAQFAQLRTQQDVDLMLSIARDLF